MGLVVLEGCEDFLVWGPTVGTPTFTPGRTGNCINCGSSAGLLYLLHPHQESDVLTLGFAMRYILHSGSGYPAVAFLMSDASATVHTEIGVNVAGQIEVRRSSTSLTPLSAVGVIQMDRWHYVEVQAKLSDTAGWIIVRVDGATVITTATNLDTKNAGTKTVYDAARVYSSSGNNVRFDDIYLMSGAGRSVPRPDLRRDVASERERCRQPVGGLRRRQRRQLATRRRIPRRQRQLRLLADRRPAGPLHDGRPATHRRHHHRRHPRRTDDPHRLRHPAQREAAQPPHRDHRRPCRRARYRVPRCRPNLDVRPRRRRLRHARNAPPSTGRRPRWAPGKRGHASSSPGPAGSPGSATSGTSAGHSPRRSGCGTASAPSSPTSTTPKRTSPDGSPSRSRRRSPSPPASTGSPSAAATSPSAAR